MFQPYNEATADTTDRIAWALCQIIDDDAPMRWTRYRFAAECIARNEKLMAELQKAGSVPRWWHCDTHGPGSHTAWGCPECVREMRASLGRARGLLVELDSVLRMAESHSNGALTASQVRAAVEPYLPLDLGKEVTGG